MLGTRRYARWWLTSLGTRKYARWWLTSLGKTAPYADPCASLHRQTLIRDVLVDFDMAPVLDALWSARIETVSSCQGEPEIDRLISIVMPNWISPYLATISFTSWRDTIWFISMCHRLDPGQRVHMSTTGEGDDIFFHVMFSPSLLKPLPRHIHASLNDERMGL